MKIKNSSKTKKKLRIKLWKLCQEYIRKRDNNTCCHCNKEVSGSNSHTSHIIPKSHGNILRYDPNNLKLLCYHCHINWWHLNPVEAGKWFCDKYPERWEYLQQEKNKIIKLKESDYECMIEDYQNRLIMV